jgi:hypothetical protein
MCAAAAVAATSAPAGASAAKAGSGALTPGNLLVSESVFTKAPKIVAGKTQLPPGCTGSNCVTAIANGSYPQVFNNALVDGSFGVTSRIFVDEMTPSGAPLGTITVPPGRLVTSFSSKSELALNLSPDGSILSFMGYVAKPGDLDVSNSNTPGVIDPTNPVPGAVYRAVAQNAATKLPWSPATDGLRNITGRVNPDGTVSIWAITSTVSGGGDQGADPNKLVEITDPVAATSTASGESFQTLRAAGFGEALRGVSFTPGSR